MKLRTAWLALFPALFITPAVFAAPRDVVSEAATMIENNYFDVAKAREIAERLRKEAAAGQFDKLTDPRDLASAITGRLQPIDRHFNVTWRPPAAPEKTPSSTSAPTIPELADQRSAYGFRRVEMRPGGIGYIDLRFFADFNFAKASEPPRKIADAALTMLSGADAVILDLRNNGGGAPAMVGYLVSAFTASDADIYNVFQARDGTESERPGQVYGNPRVDVPLFVLISGRTASAAESTAYTLQAARRATIVGEPSAGAANPGGEFPIGEGLNLFVSVATPINPITHGNWEGAGVKPDVAVPAEKALDRAEILALEAVLAQKPSGPGELETRWILEARRAQLKVPSGPPVADYVAAYAGAKVSAAGRDRLLMERGRRPPVVLARLKADIFFATDEPFRRVQFERDAAGKVKGFQFVRANGPATWFPIEHH
jgi:hypothetical protein